MRCSSTLRALVPGIGVAAPVYLWGDAGSGKTRLLASPGRAAPRLGVRRWAGSVRPDVLPWLLDETWSLVVVDGLRRSWNAARASRRPSGCSSKPAPMVCNGAAAGSPAAGGPAGARRPAHTAWAGAHVFALQPLAEPETRAALRRAADARGIVLSDEVISHLLLHFDRDMAHLMALLDRLDGYALAEKRHITIPLLRKMLAEDTATR